MKTYQYNIIIRTTLHRVTVGMDFWFGGYNMVAQVQAAMTPTQIALCQRIFYCPRPRIWQGDRFTNQFFFPFRSGWLYSGLDKNNIISYLSILRLVDCFYVLYTIPITIPTQAQSYTAKYTRNHQLILLTDIIHHINHLRSTQLFNLILSQVNETMALYTTAECSDKNVISNNIVFFSRYKV